MPALPEATGQFTDKSGLQQAMECVPSLRPGIGETHRHITEDAVREKPRHCQTRITVHERDIRQALLFDATGQFLKPFPADLNGNEAPLRVGRGLSQEEISPSGTDFE
jgi:hypothetical protein